MDPEDLMLVPQVKEMTDPSISCNLLNGSGLVFIPGLTSGHQRFPLPYSFYRWCGAGYRTHPLRFQCLDESRNSPWMTLRRVRERGSSYVLSGFSFEDWLMKSRTMSRGYRFFLIKCGSWEKRPADQPPDQRFVPGGGRSADHLFRNVVSLIGSRFPSEINSRAYDTRICPKVPRSRATDCWI